MCRSLCQQRTWYYDVTHILGTKVFHRKAPNVDVLRLTNQASRTTKRCWQQPQMSKHRKRKNRHLKPKRKLFVKEIKVIAKFSDKILPSKAEVEDFGPEGRLPVWGRVPHLSLYSTCHTGVTKRHLCRDQVQQWRSLPIWLDFHFYQLRTRSFIIAHTLKTFQWIRDENKILPLPSFGG